MTALTATVIIKQALNMEKRFTKDSLLRLLLFVGAVTVIIGLMPRNDKHSYQYEMGKPWAYSLLTAPSDMPIYLDSISMAMVRDSISRTFVPVYQRDINSEKTTLAAYATRVNHTPDINLTPGERNKLINALRKLLENGIVDQETYQEVKSGKLHDVRFIHDNTAITLPADNFLSARAAYASLDSMFTDPNFRSAIEQTSMSQFLVPNVVLDSVATRRLLGEVMQKAMAPIGVIQQGERIIDKGDIVTPELYTLLKTYDRISGSRSPSKVDRHYYPILGQLLYVVVIL